MANKATRPRDICFQYLNNSDFVQETILGLLKTGQISPIIDINLLTVSVIATGKKRLNLDLRCLEAKIKFDNCRVLFEYAFKGDLIFVWDLVSRRHRLDLFVRLKQYFGFPL